MESRYKDKDAAQAIAEWGDETVALRTYTARLLGRNQGLVVHGGGNTSAKGRVMDRLGRDIEVLYIKGSGHDLATIGPDGHPAVRLDPLVAMRDLAWLSDEDMVAELRTNLLDPMAPTPSIETLLHAFVPARFVDHTHADAILALADQPDAERTCRQVFGDALVWVPYVMPGFDLGKRCAEALEQTPKGTIIVLEKHGIITFGDTAKESYERMIAAVTKAERAIADKRHTIALVGITPVRGLESRLLPRIRGILARAANPGSSERGPLLYVKNDDETLYFLSRRDAKDLTQVGCATPDHVIRTKPKALFIENPDYGDLDTLADRIERAVKDYGKEYDAYFDAMCKTKGVQKKKLDPWPRVLALPGFGTIAVGSTLESAQVAAEVYQHSAAVMADAADIGRYEPVSPSELFDIEYWSLEQAKIKTEKAAPLQGRIALVTGAASGIGRATAELFVAMGAHVVLVDRDEQSLEKLEGAFPAARVTKARCDVTIEGEVRGAVAAACRRFGGLDLVVSNAGTAPQGRLDSDSGAESLRASLEVNLLAHNHVARAATEVMLVQKNGGCLLFNASKSASHPGPGFGPYAVAKAGVIALMRQYAIDLGKDGIRANAVNADRVRTKLFGGGVVEARARARGVTVDDYFRANLLHREVTATDVANAFVFLATAPATTGATLPVDGGIA